MLVRLDVTASGLWVNPQSVYLNERCYLMKILIKKKAELQKLRYENRLRRASVNYPNISFNDIPYLYAKVERDIFLQLTNKGFSIEKKKDVFVVSSNVDSYLTDWFSISSLKHIFWECLPNCSNYIDIVTKCLEALKTELFITI